MTSDEILRYLKAASFRPFRIHMVSGRTFDIRHREMVQVGKRDLVIFTFVSDRPDVYDDWVMIGLLLIESISFLEPSEVGRNGE